MELGQGERGEDHILALQIRPAMVEPVMREDPGGVRLQGRQEGQTSEEAVQGRRGGETAVAGIVADNEEEADNPAIGKGASKIEGGAVWPAGEDEG